MAKSMMGSMCLAGYSGLRRRTIKWDTSCWRMGSKLEKDKKDKHGETSQTEEDSET